ncbi:UNVERIFIED_CONTAM: hypothetical protein RMT77_003970 [Armadillidium vulgare]
MPLVLLLMLFQKQILFATAGIDFRDLFGGDWSSEYYGRSRERYSDDSRSMEHYSGFMDDNSRSMEDDDYMYHRRKFIRVPDEECDNPIPGHHVFIPERKRVSIPKRKHVFTPESRIGLIPEPRLGLREKKSLWRKGRIPFVFAENISLGQKKRCRKAMRLYNRISLGCIKFIKRKNQTHYLKINRHRDKCAATFGRSTRRGSPQYLNMTLACLSSYGSILHEMLHTIGLGHEHQRPDRDEYIEIMWENLISWANESYKKFTNIKVWSTFNISYDYFSLTHYSPYVFTKNGQITFRVKDPYYANRVGNRKGLSMRDILKLRIMYNCTRDRQN